MSRKDNIRFEKNTGLAAIARMAADDHEISVED
jgi:hypothetical protein